MLGSLLTPESWDDLFIHVDPFVFPPLAVHNKGGGMEFQTEPHCTEMAIPAQDYISTVFVEW